MKLQIKQQNMLYNSVAEIARLGAEHHRRGQGQGAHGAPDQPLFLGDQDQVDPRPRPRRSRAGGAG